MKNFPWKRLGFLLVLVSMGVSGQNSGVWGSSLNNSPHRQEGQFFSKREINALDTVLNYLPLVLQGWSPAVAAREGLVISEVVYDPLESEPGGEWIEIFNPGFREVELATFKIGDEELLGGSEGMLRFPDEAVIPARGVVLIANQATEFYAKYGFYPDFEMRLTHPDVPTLSPHAAWAGGNVVLLNTSDEVLLLNETDALVDAVSWGSSVFAFDPPAPDVPAGHSLERVPAGRDLDVASDWRVQPDPEPGVVDLVLPTPTPSTTGTQTETPTGMPAGTGTPTPTEGPTPTPSQTPGPFLGILLISEVQYDPANPEPAAEWIEIYYPGDDPIGLAGFRLGDEETQGGGEGMAEFPSGASIDPGQAVVVAREAQAFFDQFGFLPNFEFTDSNPGVPDMVPAPAWAGGSISLGNSGDEVLLLDPSQQLLDMLSWGSSTFAFDPPAEDVPEGHSLERYPANLDTDAAGDWLDQPAPAPGMVRLEEPTVTATFQPPVGTNTPTTTATSQAPTGTPTPEFTPTPTASLSATAAASSTPGPESHLLISEVFYDTPGTDSQEEWIEIYNSSDIAIQLSDYKIGDEETPGGLEGMVAFPSGAEISPGERIVIAQNADGFLSLYGYYPNFEISNADPSIPDMMPYETWGSGSVVMSNSGDEILLVGPLDQTLDVVVYENGTYSGVVAHPGVATGHSVARTPAWQDTDDCSVDFVDLDVPTPGY